MGLRTVLAIALSADWNADMEFGEEHCSNPHYLNFQRFLGFFQPQAFGKVWAIIGGEAFIRHFTLNGSDR